MTNNINRITGPDCAVVCIFINTHPLTPHTYRERDVVRRDVRRGAVLYGQSTPTELGIKVILMRTGHTRAAQRFDTVLRVRTSTVLCCAFFFLRTALRTSPRDMVVFKYLTTTQTGYLRKA